MEREQCEEIVKLSALGGLAPASVEANNPGSRESFDLDVSIWKGSLNSLRLRQ
jgi:hypothetical protein